MSLNVAARFFEVIDVWCELLPVFSFIEIINDLSYLFWIFMGQNPLSFNSLRIISRKQEQIMTMSLQPIHFYVDILQVVNSSSLSYTERRIS